MKNLVVGWMLVSHMLWFSITERKVIMLVV